MNKHIHPARLGLESKMNSSVAASFGLSLIVGMVLLLLVAQRTQVARDINDDSDRAMLLQDFPYLARLESAPTQLVSGTLDRIAPVYCFNFQFGSNL